MNPPPPPGGERRVGYPEARGGRPGRRPPRKPRWGGEVPSVGARPRVTGPGAPPPHPPSRERHPSTSSPSSPRSRPCGSVALGGGGLRSRRRSQFFARLGSRLQTKKVGEGGGEGLRPSGSHPTRKDKAPPRGARGECPGDDGGRTAPPSPPQKRHPPTAPQGRRRRGARASGEPPGRRRFRGRRAGRERPQLGGLRVCFSFTGRPAKRKVNR